MCQAEGGIIDLTPYSNTDGTPRYSLTQPYGMHMVMVQYIYMYSLISICCICRYTDLRDPHSRYSYAYNPCKAYQDSQNKGDCDNIYVSDGMVITATYIIIIIISLRILVLMLHSAAKLCYGKDHDAALFLLPE